MDSTSLIPSAPHNPYMLLKKRPEQLIVEETFKAFLDNQKSEKTAIVYKKEVLSFLVFAIERSHISSLRDLTRNDIISYATHLSSLKLANKTIEKKLSAIASFCKFFAHDQLIDKDILYGVTRPKDENKKETADLSDKDVKNLFENMKKDKVYHVHHRALLAVGFYTGLRSAEIRNLKFENYTKHHGHTIFRCLIKGKHTHEIPLNPFVVRCLDEHIERLKVLGFDLNEEHYLFPSIKTRKNKAMAPMALWKIFRNRLKDAGIQMSKGYRYSPHSMRATFAGHLLNTVEAPLKKVQEALGHSSPTTTMKYDKRKKDHDKSPVYGIDYS